MQEEALKLGPYQSLAGVFTPAVDAKPTYADTAVICVNAGLMHHVGPHRMHVLLARALAEQGISALRFDFSGIGDSATNTDGLPAQDLPVREINEVISDLEQRGFSRFILFGICYGARCALKAACINPKITGSILVNLGGDDTNTQGDSEVAVQYYLKRSIWNPQAWKNLLTGKVKYRNLFSALYKTFLHKLKGDKGADVNKEDLHAQLQPFIDRGASIFMVLSDRHAQIYELYRDAFDSLICPQFQILINSEADHLYTSLSSQQELINAICKWTAERIEAGKYVVEKAG